MSNRITHFEIPSDNPEANIKFFRDAFGWNFIQFGKEEYWLAVTGDEKKPGINGAIMKKRDPNQPLTNSISVDDIDVAIRKVEAAGGLIVVPKTPVPGVGWLAYFKDPDGNILGLMQEDKGAR